MKIKLKEDDRLSIDDDDDDGGGDDDKKESEIVGKT